MFIRLYKTIMIVDEAIENSKKCYLNQFMAGNGDNSTIDNPITGDVVCAVTADVITHDLLYQDRINNPGMIVYLTPMIEVGELENILNKNWYELSMEFRDFFCSSTGTANIPIDSNVRDVIKQLLCKYLAAQGNEPTSFEFSGVKF